MREALARVALVLLAPIDWAVLCVLAASELVGRLRARRAPLRPPLFEPCTENCSVVVVGWHGEGTLRHALAALRDALAEYPGRHEILLVRDQRVASVPGALCQAEAPGVTFLEPAHELDYAAATRFAIERAAHDVVVLINHDTFVDLNFLASLLTPLRHDPEVFGVASRVVNRSCAAVETGVTRIRDTGRDIVWLHEPVQPGDEARDACPVSWLHRGAIAIDRRKYRWLGGFDPLFDPFYFDDVDISHRAWKAGWCCLMAPASRVSHDERHDGSPRYDELLHAIAVRNAYTFVWKDVGDLRMLAHACLGAAGRRVRRARASGLGAGVELAAFIAALRRVRSIARGRRAVARASRRSDREVLGLVDGERNSSRSPSRRWSETQE